VWGDTIMVWDSLGTEALLGLGALAAAASFGLGLLVGRRPRRGAPAQPATVDQYALDYGMVGRKKAKAIRKVAARDWLFDLYETDFLDYGKWPTWHVMQVYASMGAVDYFVGVPLSPVESAKVEAGDDWPYFEALARQVQDHPSRFRSVHVDTSALDGG